MTLEFRPDLDGSPSDTDTNSQDLRIDFVSNELAQRIYGVHDQNLVRLEHRCSVQLVARGASLVIRGAPHDQAVAAEILGELRAKAEEGRDISIEDIDTACRFVKAGQPLSAEGGAETPGQDGHTAPCLWKIWTKEVKPQTPRQDAYMRMLMRHDLVLGLGPAGTGKTFLAVARGLQLLTQGEVDRLIITRPVVEAGEKLGFLPGDLNEKLDPYMRPIFDALNELVGAREVQKMRETATVEIAPLAYMRGRTLKRAYVILDEAQNTSTMQMKMFLTRLGRGSRMVVNGDMGQVDLPPQQKSGLRDAVQRLSSLPEVGVMRFTSQDVVRHALVARILEAYERPIVADERSKP